MLSQTKRRLATLCVAFPLSLALGAAASAQVAPGQPVPVPPAGIGGAEVAQNTDAALAAANMRIERLEGELRAVTGQMEQLMFQMRQLQDELVRAREDTEFRLRELEGVGGQTGSASQVTDEQLRQTLSTVQGAPPQNLGTLTLDSDGNAIVGSTAESGPLDLSRLTMDGEPSARPQETLGTTVAALDQANPVEASELYDVGYGHVLRGDYPQAVSTFGRFLDVYADDPLRPNAHFWLGEAHFAEADYTSAAEQFLTVFNEYPEDVKVPDALLKLGMSLERLDRPEQACATFAKLLVDYPRAPQIVLDTAIAQQSVAGC